jgi:hypothetical protein
VIRLKGNLHILRNAYGKRGNLDPRKDLPNFFIGLFFDFVGVICFVNQMIMNMVYCVLKYATIMENYLYFLRRKSNQGVGRE